MILRRISQLLWALSAHLTDEDKNYILDSLSPLEVQLFFQMDIVTQWHALRVTHTAWKLAQDYSGWDRNLLIKGALLHDIGKKAGDVSTWDRVLFVIVNTLTPRLGKKIAQEGRGSAVANLRHGFYIHYHHPAGGARLAELQGLDPCLVKLIREHHDPPQANEPIELTILREADELN